MNNFYICENNQDWTPTNAKTLAGAKRAASRNQTFQGSDIFVGQKTSSGAIRTVASKKHQNAIDMAATGKWQNH